MGKKFQPDSKLNQRREGMNSEKGTKGLGRKFLGGSAKKAEGTMPKKGKVFMAVTNAGIRGGKPSIFTESKRDAHATSTSKKERFVLKGGRWRKRNPIGQGARTSGDAPARAGRKRDILSWRKKAAQSFLGEPTSQGKRVAMNRA